MTQPPYKRPPITEAVIEVRFAKVFDIAGDHKVVKKFRTLYSGYQELIDYDVKIEISGSIPTTDAIPHTVHRFSSPDMTQLLILKDSSFAVSQLAPYQGWDEFLHRFVRDWKAWKRLMGFQEIKRIGVRYINRIDIPFSGPILEHEEYLKVYPELPDVFGPTLAYAVQALLPLEDMKCVLNLNTAIVTSPLLNHTSFLIDQDIAKEVDLPQNDKGIYSLLNGIREKKNNVFELCITDKARELFNK